MAKQVHQGHPGAFPLTTYAFHNGAHLKGELRKTYWSLKMLSNTVTPSHTWLLDIWNVASLNWGVLCEIHQILKTYEKKNVNYSLILYYLHVEVIRFLINWTK